MIILREIFRCYVDGPLQWLRSVSMNVIREEMPGPRCGAERLAGSSEYTAGVNAKLAETGTADPVFVAESD